MIRSVHGVVGDGGLFKAGQPVPASSRDLVVRQLRDP
jgi:hypothetical protein